MFVHGVREKEREGVRERAASVSYNSWCRGVMTFCLQPVRYGGRGGGDTEGAVS